MTDRPIHAAEMPGGQKPLVDHVEQRDQMPRARVGIVCPYSFARPGGVQNHVLGLAGWLTRQGSMVQIFAPDEPPAGMLDEYGLASSQYFSAGRSVALKANGSVARINFSVGSARRAKHWLDQGDFDVIHIHEPMTPSVALQTLLLTDRPVTATFHTARPLSNAWKTFNSMLPKAVKSIDAAIAVSSVAAQVAWAHTGIDSVIIGNGLQVDDYPCAATTGTWRGGDRPRVTFLGRYDEPRKGFNVLTAALPLIRAEHPDVDVVVIGHGSPTQIDGVRFLGGVDDTERNQQLAQSDVYIAPQTGRESFGIVLIEALACGAPVVASDLPAFTEVLTDEQGVCGHQFSSGKPAALAQAVNTSLAEARDLRLTRGREIAERYDWSRLGPQIVEMYKLADQRRFSQIDAPRGRQRRGERRW